MTSIPYGPALPVKTTTTAAENIKKGNGVSVGDTVFIAAEDKTTVANTATEVSVWASPMVLRGAPKEAAAASRAWSRGDKLYWDEADQRWSDDSSGNKLAGIALEPATTTATTGDVFYPGPVVQT